MIRRWSTIWEGMRRYFHEEAHLPVEVVLFQSYETQVAALSLRPASRAAHRHRLEYQPRLSPGRCMERAALPADRDARHRSRLDDQDRRGRPEAPISTLAGSQRIVPSRSGSRDSGHAAILPVHFLEREGLAEGRDYRSLRFDSDVGKHGDTGRSEVDVVRAVLDGRADAGAIGSPFWNAVRSERLVPEGALTEIWTSPPYNHCMFTARSDLDPALERQFAEALFGDELRQSDPSPVLEAEGLRQWMAPQLEAYASCATPRRNRAFLSNLA